MTVNEAELALNKVLRGCDLPLSDVRVLYQILDSVYKQGLEDAQRAV